MAVVNISGVAYESISSIAGISKASIADIGGVPVSSGPTCTTVTYRYNGDASTSCISSEASYEFDSTNNILYISGQCGGTQASNGYYSDGVSVYSWFNGTWSYYASCSSGPSCTTVEYGYSPEEPSAACFEKPQPFDYDANSNLLYVEGGCGTTFAPAGYYSDYATIYFWDGSRSFFPVGNCER
jgi:hypothetical protein